MTTLFSPITAMLTPDMFNAVGARIGVSGEQVQKAVDIAIPLLTRGGDYIAGTPEGQVRLANAINSADTGVLGNMSNLASSFGLDSGDDLLKRLFGDEARVVTAGIKDATGIDIAPVLGMAGPLVLGFLNSMAQKEGLDTNGLMKKIKSQARSFDRSQSESAVLVDSTLAQVEEVRKLKGSFSADEWNTVRAGPLAAAALVIEAAPSKDKRTVEEAAAAVASVGEAGTGFATTSLMATLFHDGVADLAVEGISDPMSKAKAGLTLVQRVAPGEAETYKKIVLDAAYAAAQAAKEGGFLGVGSKLVSKEEQAALDSLAVELQVA